MQNQSDVTHDEHGDARSTPLAMGFILAILFSAIACRVYAARVLYMRRFLRQGPVTPTPDAQHMDMELGRAQELERGRAAQLSALPTTTWTSETQKKAGGSTGTQCSLCLQDYKVGDVVRMLQCGHLYHVACLDPWLFDSQMGRQRSCPLCGRDPLEAAASAGSDATASEHSPST